jgi:hypothetical protein
MLCFTFDRLDAVVLEERIAEARRVPSGYRCLALLHRAEAAVPREAITIFAAIFTGAHRSWRKQSIQCNRCDQCRRADGPCFQHGGGGHLKPPSPRLRCVPFDPRAKFQHDDALENGHAAPAREITSRHGVDKRSLLPLAAPRDAVARSATSRVALEADVFILQRLLCRNQCRRGLHNWCRESRVGSSERSSYMAYEKGKKARGPLGHS